MENMLHMLSVPVQMLYALHATLHEFTTVGTDLTHVHCLPHFVT